MLQQMNLFLQNAWKQAGFKEMTEIQHAMIPSVLDGKDVIAESPTGTGKTLAYVLPILQMIDGDAKNPQVVILSPTRELVMQIQSEIVKFTENSPILSASFIGGVDIKRQVEKLKKHPHIIIGTPGRVLELIRMKKLKMHEIKTIVFDEYDQMIKQKMESLLTDIVKTTMKQRQLIFVSATMPGAAEEAAKKMANDPTIVRIQRNENEGKVKHVYVVTELREKLDTIRKLVHMEDVKALAFLNDPFRLDEMEGKLIFRKIAAAALHAEAKSQERANTLQGFRQGKIQLLLATDVAARGLDIEDVTHVIHIDIPTTMEQYIHRSGRTGRMGKEGTVISLVTKDQQKSLLQLSKKLGIEMQQVEVYKGSLVEKRSVLASKKIASKGQKKKGTGNSSNKHVKKTK